MLDNAENVTIEQCDLNGCGLAGLHDNMGNSNIFIKKCYIHNNSLGAYTNINGDVWQHEIEDHECFRFENNRIENNGPDRVAEPTTIADNYSRENKVLEKTFYADEIKEWKDVPNLLTVKYWGIERGDYFHLLFVDKKGVTYDFGFGENNFGKYELYRDTETGTFENPELLCKKFKLFWEIKKTTYPCCDGEYDKTEGLQPSIVKLELIEQW